MQSTASQNAIMDRPVKINDLLTIRMEGDKAQIVSRFGIPPGIVRTNIRDWLRKNQGNRRFADVEERLEVYEAQLPAVPAVSREEREKIRERMARTVMKFRKVSLDKAREIVDRLVFEN